MNAGADIGARIQSLVAAERRARGGRERRWLMFEAWDDLLLASWPARPEVLRPLVPSTLALDTFDGTAWVSIVPFKATDMRLFDAHVAIHGQVEFCELNFRTYVQHDGIAGVYFLSLDCPGAVASLLGDKIFGLPFKDAAMTMERRGTAIHVESRRRTHGGPAAEFVATYTPGGHAATPAVGSLDHFLTDRLSLFVVDRFGHLHRGDIWHEPWQVQPVDVAIATNTIASAAGIMLPPAAPHAAYAARTDSLVYPPVSLDTV